jgi:hypothetical protein
MLFSSNVRPVRRLVEDILEGIPKDELLLKAIAACGALGLHNEAISKALGVTIEEVDYNRSLPLCQKVITNIQVSMGMSAEQMIAAQVTKALEVKARHLNSDDDKLSAKAATEIIERFMGKATQTVVNVSQSITTGQSSAELDKKLTALQDRLETLSVQRNKLKALKTDSKTLAALPAAKHSEQNQVL